MYSERLDSIEIVEYVINNLCKDTIIELVKIFGEDYKLQTISAIQDSDMHVIKLKNTNEPVGLYGLIVLNENAAGIYLLTTDNLHKGNIITFLKSAKKQVNEWAKEYQLILDNCYKLNDTIKKWLNILGFKQSNYQDDDFIIYYKGNIELYKEIQ